jgi:hypothetical protein
VDTLIMINTIPQANDQLRRCRMIHDAVTRCRHLKSIIYIAMGSVMSADIPWARSTMELFPVCRPFTADFQYNGTALWELTRGTHKNAGSWRENGRALTVKIH